MPEFCYFEGDFERAKTLANAMKSKHGCDVAIVQSTRLTSVYFVVPAEQSDKWKLKYEKVYCTNSAN